MKQATSERIIRDEVSAKALAAHLVGLNAPFAVEPRPDGWHFITPVKYEQYRPFLPTGPEGK